MNTRSMRLARQERPALSAEQGRKDAASIMDRDLDGAIESARAARDFSNNSDDRVYWTAVAEELEARRETLED